MTADIVVAERIRGVPASVAQQSAPVRGRRSRWSLFGSPWLVLVLCLAAFGYGVTTIASAPVGQFGLLQSASPLYAASILLAAVAFGLAMRRNNTAAAVMSIVLMIVTQRLPRALCTDAPMYAWTYKHLGVVDYIQTSQSLARGTDIYNGWPGLFALTAWFSDLTGIKPMDIAHWFTPIFHLALSGLVYAAARAWRLSAPQALVAAFLVTTLNWVEQDYYSPQAVTVLLAVAILMLFGLARERRVGAVLIVILFAAATITHQLTPFWLLLVAGLLVVGRQLRPWWIVIPMAAIAIGFFFYNFDITRQYGSLLSLDVVRNASTNGYRTGMPGQIVTSLVMRVLSIAMWLFTATVLVVRWRRGRPFWALGVLALSPLLILGGQGYGGEAVFRVFLYSLIGCSFVLAPVLLAALQGSRLRLVAGLSALVVATAMSAQSYFGSWFTNLISRDQVWAANYVLRGADYPAYVTPLVPVWPERSSGNYVKYARHTDKYDHSLMFQANLVGSHFDTDADYQKLMAGLATRNDVSTYLVLSKPMAIYGAYFGVFPIDAVANLEKRLAGDPLWKRITDQPDVAVYVHRVSTELR